jgi:urease accessory protein
LLFEDATSLGSADGESTSPGVLGEHTVFGSLYVVVPGGTRLDGGTDALRELADAIDERAATGDAHAGATTLPNDAGVLVRALGETSEPVTDALWRAWDRARRPLFDVSAPEVRTR